MGTTVTSRRLATMLRATLTKDGRAGQALLEWVEENRAVFWPGPKGRAKTGAPRGEARKISWAKLATMLADMAEDPLPAELAGAAENIATVLSLGDQDRAVLEAGLAVSFHPRIARLRWALEMAHEDLARVAGMLAGADAVHAGTVARTSMAVQLGLFEVDMAHGGGVSFDASWWFESLLARGGHDPERLIEALAGKRQRAALALADFPAMRGDVDFVARLLAGAVESRACGINVLLHGPPGVGKTELARALAAHVGAALYAVGEADSDGTEPRRHERVAALLRAQRALQRDDRALLLFDELEDLIGDANKVDGGKRFANRAGSKIFVNRMLETNGVPVIWTSNAIDNVDSAYLRRMSFVLKLDHPRGRERDRVLARMASMEDSAIGDDLSALARQAPETPSVARVALRAARIAGAASGDDERVARALVGSLRGQAVTVADAPARIDLSLFECDTPIAGLVERLTRPGAPLAFSVLLAGPPGTGKTQLAGEVAERLGRPLATRRASDLLSKWIGETEANIAAAFRDAAAEGSVLFFDEADSLLFDRQTARTSWEVTQVNELLTWLDRHPLPVFAATNDQRRLDPAALRRFTFKLALNPLSAESAAHAFERFFGCAAPAGLARLGALTPGDFAVVARQVKVAGPFSTGDLLARLEAELAAKPGGMATIGF
ncbi:ATP-binding protein [Sphingomonas sp. QA11]|uniref:AAA family ATPase n=1 Tax=Sphingomonas sp. QA11 TaxID=2950605 RepID=UPI002349B4D0|nr:AAA family ATPase [Sphingomonas sp. QA11]WCM26889.1 ATP-binding protein [Sphingomonas sp. QA11]